MPRSLASAQEFNEDDQLRNEGVLLFQYFRRLKAELDQLNERLLETLNDTGRLYLTQNRVKGRYAIRFSVGQTNTTRDHVQRAWQTIKETAASL